MSDPIDGLLDLALVYAEKRLVDPAFVNFEYTFPRNQQTCHEQIADDKHDLVEIHADERGQRGMYAKCNMRAGTRLLVSQPIAVYWDVENDGVVVHSNMGTGRIDESSNQNDKCQHFASNSKASFSRQASHPRNISCQGEDKKLDYVQKLKEKDQLEANIKKEESARKTITFGDHKSCDNDNFACNRDTRKEGKLLLRVLGKIKASPSIWTNTVSKLYPRDMATRMPPWVCTDALISLEIEKEVLELHRLFLFGPSEDNEIVCREIAVRLPLIIRYNAFSIDTSSELFVYQDLNESGLASLAGVGLYGPELSYFNHSCLPNTSRFSIGDVMFLFTNRDINKGDELCHSYLSHEYLCESEETRCAILANDFLSDMNHCHDANEKNPPLKRVKGNNIQTKDIICVSPFNLASSFDPATGLLYKSEGPNRDFKCNTEYLVPIWKARVLEGLGRSNKHGDDTELGLEHALSKWEAAIEFAEATFPQMDVRKVTLYVQASLCASVNAFHDWAKVALAIKGCRIGDPVVARKYADKALEMHDAIFGGGQFRFLKRYSKELLASGSPKRQLSRAQLLYNLEKMWGFKREN